MCILELKRRFNGCRIELKMKIRERILIKLRGEDFHIRVLLICVIFSAIACNDNIKSKKLEAQVEDNTPMGCAVPTASGIDSKDLDIELLLAISEIREDPKRIVYDEFHHLCK